MKHRLGRCRAGKCLRRAFFGTRGLIDLHAKRPQKQGVHGMDIIARALDVGLCIRIEVERAAIRRLRQITEAFCDMACT